MGAMPGRTTDHADANVLRDADACVKCGLCLPQCPTYRETGHEGHSPRGRIALVQGLVSGLVPATDVLEDRLDGCLSCRRCEAVCPANVAYSRVLDAGRARLADLRPGRVRWSRWMSGGLGSRVGVTLLRMAVRTMVALGMPAVIRGLGPRMGRLAAYLSAAGAMARGRGFGSGVEGRPVRLATASRGNRGDDVALAGVPANHAAREIHSDPIFLFEGCVTRALERDALTGARSLLEAAGYRVLEAPGQTCCGALAQHAGLPEQADTLARCNIDAFSGDAPIATITSGCAATLVDAPAFARRVRDLGTCLLPRADRLQFRPLTARIALHEPCTLTNVLKAGQAMRTLLRRIPGVELVELDPGGGCCGAAGTYFLDRPEMADRLLARKIAAIDAMKPDLILSGNVGCTLHLLAGLERARLRSAAGPAKVPAVSEPEAVNPQGTPAMAAQYRLEARAMRPPVHLQPGAQPANRKPPPVLHPASLLASLLEPSPPGPPLPRA